MNPIHVMQLSYDAKADVLYISLGDPRPAVSREMGDDVLLRLDAETGAVVGLTVLNLSTRSADAPLPVLADLAVQPDE